MFPMIWVALFILGLCFGSFFNVIIYRLPRQESILNPPSHCPRCGKPINWYDNLPLLSYLILRGKCRKCGNKISLRYPTVELLTGLIFLSSYYLAAQKLSFFFFSSLFFLSILLVVAFIDLDTFIIPDKLILPAIFISLGLLIFDFTLPSIKILPLLPGYISSSLLGALAAFLFFYFLAFISPLIFGKEGMGGGDIKLAFFLGLYLGYYVFVAFFVAFLAGSLIGLGLVYLRGKEKREEIPFGPFLSLGGAVALFFGPAVVNWYLNLIGF